MDTLFSAEFWRIGADVATVGGVIVGLASVFFIYGQIMTGKRISEAQFLLNLNDFSLKYFDIAVKFSPGGDWHNEKGAPSEVSDEAKLDAYMGLFEICETMIRSRTLSEQLVLNSFAYRCLDIVRSGPYIDKKLSGPEKSYWELFNSFAERCKQYERQKGQLYPSRTTIVETAIGAR